MNNNNGDVYDKNFKPLNFSLYHRIYSGSRRTIGLGFRWLQQYFCYFFWSQFFDIYLHDCIK